MTYKPSKRVEEVLTWGLSEVQSVPYGVTLRWLFYQCVQKLGLVKGDYGPFKKWVSRARKEFWGGWRPWTLVDDTRKIYRAGGGWDSFKDWFDHFKDEAPRYPVYPTQDVILQIWFEAQAMYSQFSHYASPYRVPLVPFKGDASIKLKWEIAEYLAELYQRYRKPIVALYFGDYEPHRDRGSRAKGLTIPLDALKDITNWFGGILLGKGVVEKENIADTIGDILFFERVGLNSEHVERWSLPENPERPGEYQWEALDDDRAHELIQGAIQEHWDIARIEALELREQRDAEKWKKLLEEIEGRI